MAMVMAQRTPRGRRRLRRHAGHAGVRQGGGGLGRGAHVYRRDGCGRCNATRGDDVPGVNDDEGMTARIAKSEAVVFGSVWIGLVALASSFKAVPDVDDISLIKTIIDTSSSYSAEAIRDAGGTFFFLFNVMGIWPAIYAALLLPNEANFERVKAWPFCVLSFGLGAFALLPYFVLRSERKTTDRNMNTDEPATSLPYRVAESKINASLLLALSMALAVGAASTIVAPGDGWQTYTKLFGESALVHVTTLDFCTLCALAPYAISRDLEARSSDAAPPSLGPIPLSSLAYLPVIGPCIYLILRPSRSL